VFKVRHVPGSTSFVGPGSTRLLNNHCCLNLEVALRLKWVYF